MYSKGLGVEGMIAFKAIYAGIIENMMDMIVSNGSSKKQSLI